ncbi:uncharacterized protein LOC114320587 [Camellia sinensis]|uniref:uncharacterized protein LOC114320587 n=1 Tax=Camellia sinensis TaxID=4442 RepID=UPI001035DE78|nr:uncharacterized protein LOC114320587 [Camellia sinensis]
MKPPKKFTPPKFMSYDGKLDPLTHISHYRQMMSLWSRDEALMCKVFPSNLGESRLRWFDRLPTGSIYDWKQLSDEFLARFVSNTKSRKSRTPCLVSERNRRKHYVIMQEGVTSHEREQVLQEEITKAVQIQQVMSVGLVPKKDLEEIQHPHIDALIITVRIGKRFDVRRVLVDQGSATDILYYDLFRKLSLSEQHLTPAAASLVGFNSQPEWPLGRIVLPIVAGTKTLQLEFLVINTPSPYNAILGRPWIHQIEAVPSTYNHLIRFPTEHGVEQISRDQVTSKHCFIAAMKDKQLCNRVPIIEVAE